MKIFCQCLVVIWSILFYFSISHAQKYQVSSQEISKTKQVYFDLEEKNKPKILSIKWLKPVKEQKTIEQDLELVWEVQSSQKLVAKDMTIIHNDKALWQPVIEINLKENDTYECRYVFALEDYLNNLAIKVKTNVGEAQTDVLPIRFLNKPIIDLISKSITTEEGTYLFKAGIRSTSELKAPIVFVNDKRLRDEKGGVNKLIQQKAYEHIFEKEIQLEEGVNEIYIMVENRYGMVTSSKVIVNYNKPAELMSNLYILSIGVANYNNKIFNLNYSDNDAQDFTKAFERQVNLPTNKQLFKNIFIETLVDEEATSLNVKRQIAKVKKQVNEQDIFMLFLSMHGEQEQDGKYYLLTHETEPDLISATSLSFDWVNNEINQFPCTVMQFFDACYSGNTGLKGTTHEKVVDDLVESLSTKNMFCYASSSSSAPSRENKKWENGAFTEAIIDCFNGKTHKDVDGTVIKGDLDENGYLDTTELNSYISKVVKLFTDGKQRPKMAMKHGEPLTIYVIE